MSFTISSLTFNDLRKSLTLRISFELTLLTLRVLGSYVTLDSLVQSVPESQNPTKFLSPVISLYIVSLAFKA